MQVHALTPERLADWLSFFDRDAFATNPEWAGCYCRAYTMTEGFYDQDAAANRAAQCSAIADGRFHGFLAYEDGAPIGWCQAGPAENVITAKLLGRPPEPGSATITCFVIRADQRGKGVAGGLLDAVVAGLGGQRIYAFPKKNPKTPAHLYAGTVQMYERSGFVRTEETDQRIVMVRFP